MVNVSGGEGTVEEQLNGWRRKVWQVKKVRGQKQE